MNDGSTMTASKLSDTSKLFEKLVSGLEPDRAEAQAIIEKRPQNIDLQHFRKLAINAISTQFSPDMEVKQKDFNISWTRCWLLSTLGRISKDDLESETVVIKHLDSKDEPYLWARYWALEGLIVGKVADAGELAQSLKEREKEPLVRQLAIAYLALNGDDESRQEIEKGLSDPKLLFETLRALRTVPFFWTVKPLCDLVDTREYSDETWYAIIALGCIPISFANTENAAQSIARFITEARKYSMRDALRTKAIYALGNLKRESSTPILIQELADYSPTISREAALSLEIMMGTGMAVARVVEAASKAEQQRIQRYASAMRWMNRDLVTRELAELMLSGPTDQQEAARTLLSEIGGAAAYQRLRALTSAMDQYAKTLEQAEGKIQEIFKTSIDDARSGYKAAVSMDLAVFSLGLILLAVSAGLVIFKSGTLDSWVGIGLTSGTGVAGVIYSLLISNPRNQVDKAVDHLMLLKILFLAYLRQLHQADQAYTRLLLDDKTTLTAEEVQKFCKMVGETMNFAIECLAKAAGKKTTDDNK